MRFPCPSSACRGGRAPRRRDCRHPALVMPGPAMIAELAPAPNRAKSACHTLHRADGLRSARRANIRVKSTWDGNMERALLDALSLAARRGIDFRSRTAEALERPLQSYDACVADFDAPLPETPQAPLSVIGDLADKAERGLQMATGPRFFGWVIGGSHPIGVAADWLTGAWGQNTGNHHAAPAAAAAETVVSRWLLELLDLPRQCSVGFVTGATVANFVCLAAARGAVLRGVGWDVEANGLFGAPPITVLIGDDAHTTVFSGLQFLGLGHDRVVRVATDGQGAILAPAFAAAIEKARGPLIAILQAGQLNTGAFDPFAEIIPLARRAG